MPLTAADPHHWSPIPAVVDWLTNRLSPDARVLEIGPGHAPFFRADTFVDFAPWPIKGVPAEKLVKCDIATESLPFADKSFDFIYCRHVLEDMWNPFHLCREMERVGKAGYIETPSPIAELTRGVDGPPSNPPQWRGYHHHRWVVWVSGDILTFISKYPIIEYLPIDDGPLAASLREPRYWNTFYLWNDRIRLKHEQSPVDYDIPRDYAALLWNAAGCSGMATREFWHNIPSPTVTVAPNLIKSA